MMKNISPDCVPHIQRANKRIQNLKSLLNRKTSRSYEEGLSRLMNNVAMAKESGNSRKLDTAVDDLHHFHRIIGKVRPKGAYKSGYEQTMSHLIARSKRAKESGNKGYFSTTLGSMVDFHKGIMQTPSPKTTIDPLRIANNVRLSLGLAPLEAHQF